MHSKRRACLCANSSVPTAPTPTHPTPALRVVKPAYLPGFTTHTNQEHQPAWRTDTGKRSDSKSKRRFTPS